MNPEKIKLLAALVIGLVAGFLLTNLFTTRYTVTILNQRTAIRTDKRTGQTWSSSYTAERALIWTPIETPVAR